MDAPAPTLNRLAARPLFPYPGLRPFEAEEWPIFFGRETMTDEVIDRLGLSRFVLIHGASGSGKSSLVRAGVLPRLARQHLRHGTPWFTCAMRPSGGPLWNLATELARLEGRADDQTHITDIMRLFNRRGATLAKVIASLDGLRDKRLCILVDQFEELFRYEHETSREEAELFVDLLISEIPPAADGDAEPEVAAELDQPSGKIHIILTMRSEFLGECARFDGLAEAVNRTQYLVPHLSRPDLVRAITQPAALFGGRVAAELADRLIADTRGQPDELPLIQHALMLFWHTVADSGTGGEIVLTAAMLDQAGSPAQALSDHADRVLAAAAPDEPRKATAEKLFRALTDINADGQAIRRPQSFRELLAVCEVPEESLRAIIDAFRAEGVSFLTPYFPATINDKTIIDISHEALIRCWKAIGDRRTGWLRQEFDDGMMWRSLLMQAEEYTRDRKRVLSPATTVEREKWIASQTPAWSERYGGNWVLVSELLQAGRKQIVRARRRRSFVELVIVFTAASAILGLICGEMDLDAEEISNFGVFGGVVILSWTGLIVVLMLLDHGLEFARRSRARRLARAGRAVIAVPRRYGPTGNVFWRKLVRIFSGMGRFWYIPVVLSYFIWSDSAVLPLLRQPSPTEIRLGDQADDDEKYSRAFDWYLKAAKNGDAIGELRLARLLIDDKTGMQNHEAALFWYQKSAEQGNGNAQVDLARMYEDGREVNRDYHQALTWYLKAAATNNAEARYRIGLLYYHGYTGTKDPKEASIWFRAAAEQGHTGAENFMGILYEYGDGVEKKPDLAMVWYRKAAEQGNAAAQYFIGELYRDGEGMPADLKQAFQWFTKAADQDDADAEFELGGMLRTGTEITGKATTADNAQALTWYLKAARQGNANAEFSAGEMYRLGLGTKADNVAADGWYRKAAEQGNAAAQTALGHAYSDGLGVEKSYVEAMYWFRKAADQGNDEAQNATGVMYEFGMDVPRVYEEAMAWFRKAADQGNAAAQNNVGELLMQGLGVPKDYAAAMTWFSKAAKQNVAGASARAQYHIGELYQHGWGLTADLRAAAAWMRKAADRGDEDAKAWLKSH